MAKKIVWTKRADKKYDAIVEYLSKEQGERVTEEFIKRTYSFLDLLIDFPEIGTVENAEKSIRGFIWPSICGFSTELQVSTFYC